MRASVLIVAALLCTTGACAADTSPKGFLSEEIRTDNGAVQLADLAARKGGRADVRVEGRAGAPDAARKRAQDAALARKLGVAVPDEPDDDSKKQLKDLTALEGRAFDQAFARYLLYDRRRDVTRLQAEAGSGPAPTADLARRELPDAERALARAQSLDRAVGNQ